MNSVSLIVSPINSVNWLTLIIGIIGQKNSDEIFIFIWPKGYNKNYVQLAEVCQAEIYTAIENGNEG